MNDKNVSRDANGYVDQLPLIMSVPTVIVTRGMIESWKAPRSQRPITLNDTFKLVIDQLKKGGRIHGIIILGILDGETYLVDGGHRAKAFLASGRTSAEAQVSVNHYETEAELDADFVRHNSHIVRMKNDDLLRAMESSYPVITAIRQSCPFIGYSNVRRNAATSPLVSMQVALRIWWTSKNDYPSIAGASAIDIVKTMSQSEAFDLIRFFTVAYRAWGNDLEVKRLYGFTNLTLCAWIYRRTVLVADEPRPGRRAITLDDDLFFKALLSLSASADFCAWIGGRNLSVHNRMPCFRRIKTLMGKRLAAELGHAVKLPSPEWETGGPHYSKSYS